MVQTHYGIFAYQFQRGKARAKYYLVNGDFIIVLCFFNEFAQRFCTALFNSFKFFANFVHTIPYGNNIVRKENVIGRIQLVQLIVVWCLFSKIIEKTLKYIWHPIPTWPHIKSKTIPYKLPCSAPNGLVFLVNRHIVSLFCQIAGSRKGCKPRSDDNNSFAHRYLYIIYGTSILLNARLWK